MAARIHASVAITGMAMMTRPGSGAGSHDLTILHSSEASYASRLEGRFVSPARMAMSRSIAITKRSNGSPTSGSK